MTSLTLEPIFGSTWPALLLTGLTGCLLFFVRPAGVRLNPTRMRSLLILRSLAMLLILLAMLRPSIIRTDSRPTPASLVVLADASRSMTLPDGDGRTRWETQGRVLNGLAPALASLDKDLEVIAYEYGENVLPIELNELSSFIQSEPKQRQTDLAQPLKVALSGASGRPLAGIVMIGDGTSTVVESNPGTVVRNLEALDVPLWTVPIGPPAGDSQTKDVAVEQLAETFRVFSKNLFRVTATVEASGMVGRDIAVTVVLVKNDGGEEELARRIVIPKAPTESLPLDIELLAPEPGNYRLEVRAETQQGETIAANNRQVAFLDVREGGGRIYYIEAQPRLEQLFLRRALDEASDFVMTLQLAPQSEARWPISVGQAFKPGQYDVIVLGDIPAPALGNENLELLVQAVENGAGLLMLGGQRTFDLGGYANSPLARILPVQLQSARGGVRIQDDTSTEDPVTLKIRKPHPITRLGYGNESDEIWRGLKPLVGANRFANIQPDPTVEVLLESLQGEPMLVVSGYGSGRLALFAGDTTWQWWRQGKGDVHRRFWRQIVLWLLSREGPELDSIWARLDSRRFAREKPSSFVAGVQSLSETAERTRLQAEVIALDGSRFPVPLAEEASTGQPIADRPLVSGTLPDLEGGIYKLRVFPAASIEQSTNDSAASLTTPLKEAEVLFQVVDIDAELNRPIAEITRLQQLSALTVNAGGESFHPDEIDRLLGKIKELRSRASLPVVERMRLGEGPISGWALLLAFTGLLCSEWFLRKRWGLA